MCSSDNRVLLTHGQDNLQNLSRHICALASLLALARQCPGEETSPVSVTEVFATSKLHYCIEAVPKGSLRSFPGWLKVHPSACAIASMPSSHSPHWRQGDSGKGWKEKEIKSLTFHPCRKGNRLLSLLPAISHPHPRKKTFFF